MAERLKLNDNQRRRLRNLRRIDRAGGDMTTQQQTRFANLRDQRQQNKAFNQTYDPKGFKGEAAVADYAAQQGINYGNADQYNPFGSQTTTIDPVTGRPVVKQELSGANQNILDTGQAITQQGQGLAQQGLNSYNRFSFGGADERNRIEDAVFQRLNRDTEMNRDRERASKEQELYNKGIPYSADPNSRYQKELGDINRRYDDMSTDYRLRAIEQGGEELQRDYGIGLGVHQQGMADITNLQQQGSGMMLPSFQGFQGAGYNLNSPLSMQLGFDQLALQRELGQGQLGIAQGQLSLAQQQAARQGAQPPPSPFDE